MEVLALPIEKPGDPEVALEVAKPRRLNFRRESGHRLLSRLLVALDPRSSAEPASKAKSASANSSATARGAGTAS